MIRRPHRVEATGFGGQGELPKLGVRRNTTPPVRVLGHGQHDSNAHWGRLAVAAEIGDTGDYRADHRLRGAHAIRDGTAPDHVFAEATELGLGLELEAATIDAVLGGCGLATLSDDMRFAVDDAGTGFASLRHILELAPSHLKLDRGLVS